MPPLVVGKVIIPPSHAPHTLLANGPLTSRVRCLAPQAAAKRPKARVVGKLGLKLQLQKEARRHAPHKRVATHRTRASPRTTHVTAHARDSSSISDRHATRRIRGGRRGRCHASLATEF